jgi:hypothetical protein
LENTSHRDVKRNESEVRAILSQAKLRFAPSEFVAMEQELAVQLFLSQPHFLG